MKETLSEKEIKKLLPHIRVIAKNYSKYNVPFKDLVQEGILGVYKAKENYNENIGGTFSAYAIFWIKQSILNALSEQSKLVHLPFGKINLFRKISKVKDLYFQKYGRDATEFEATTELQLDPATYKVTLTSNVVSIDENINNEEDLNIKDILYVTPDVYNAHETEDMKHKVSQLLKHLNDREKYIIQHVFGLDCDTKTLEEIGKNLNLTRERCRQIKQGALEKLKKHGNLFLG